MREPLILASALLATATLRAQQLPQLSQYPFNDYIYNPAVAGSRPWFEVRSGHRYQWVGITDAPRTFTLSATTPLASKMGIGALLFTDHVGPTRRTGFQGSYAYHLGITEDIKLSLSVSAGILQFMIDGSKITFHDGGDPLIDDQVRGGLVPDASFGFLVYHPKWWVGATAPQLFRNKVRLYDEASQSLDQLAAHYYAMGGYRWQVAEDWQVEPQFLVKYVAPVPVKLDLTALVRYKEMFWLGGTYRTNDAFSAMLGIWWKRSFQFGYAYDLTTTGLKKYSDGTHEVMLAVTFPKAKGAAAPAGSTP